jgi:hypothetical protein
MKIILQAENVAYFTPPEIFVNGLSHIGQGIFQVVHRKMVDNRDVGRLWASRAGSSPECLWKN